MQVSCCRLSDGTVSVKLDSHEIAMLPRRAECTMDDLEQAFKKVLGEAEAGEWE